MMTTIRSSFEWNEHSDKTDLWRFLLSRRVRNIAFVFAGFDICIHFDMKGESECKKNHTYELGRGAHQSK